MAKTIKFNLICDGKPVRTIEDLQNNFCLEDILAYYRNGLLQRWLLVRGYTEKLQEVDKITGDDALHILRALIRIFDISTDKKEVEQGIYMLRYTEEREELYEAYQQEDNNVAHIIEDYHTGYCQLVEGILDHPDDIALIKANIAQMVAQYPRLLRLDYRNLFWDCAEKSPLAVFCLLMNETCRSFYLPIEKTTDSGETYLDTSYNPDKKEMYDSACKMLSDTKVIMRLGENLLSFSGMTDGYWKDLAAAGKRYMVLSMGSGDYVRSAGQTGADLAYSDVKDQFVILNGIDYKCNNSTHVLLYMEV